jgi:ATP-binding cassette subfamily F protein 3
LFSTPELLLLDEPTNYLDLEGASWLEGYLRKYPHTVLIVSHDRELLNRSVTHILALKHGKLAVHPGNYDTYMRKEAEKAALAMGMKAKQDAEKERLQSFVDRFRATASKSRQAQSRVKMLAKMQDIAIPLAERTIPFKFENPEKASSPLFELVGADLGYAPGQPVLKNVTLRLDHDDRIVVVGPNGQGKTTLVKSIGARLGLLAGQRMGSKSIKVGYFSQDQLDELHAGETVLDHVRTLTPSLSEAQRRSIAAQMGFGQEKIDTKVEKLSGGEKVRLLLGLTAFQKPHVLILDEPTSHLDIDSREALIHALNDYAGAVLLITHDVYLAEATADRLWLVNNGRAAPYEGDISDYRALVMDADRGGGGASGAASADTGAPQSSKAARREAAAARQSLAPLKRRIEDAEKHLEMCRADIGKIDRQLADPDLYTSNVHKVAQLNKRRADTLRHAEAAEEEWLAASEAYENGLAALASEDA